MEDNNLKLKFKIATIMFILNTLSNHIIKQISEILEIKINNTENKTDNYYWIFKDTKRKRYWRVWINIKTSWKYKY